MGRDMKSDRNTISSDVYSRLREDIICCRVPPGSKLNIQQIVRDHGVSLGAVREALSKLSAEGLVQSFQRRGYVVPELTRENLVQLTAARIEIEKLCLRNAIEHASLEWESEIIASVYRLNSTPYLTGVPSILSPEWALAHKNFHNALVASCENTWLLKMRSLLYDQSERYRQYSVPMAKSVRNVQTEHSEIAEAVRLKDTAKSEVLISQHFQRTCTILVEALE